MKNPFHVMLIPTLGCPANCEYCWSSEVGSPVMPIETVKEIVEWLKDFRKDDRVTITFHGGEPLLAGEEFYRQALPLLSEGLSHLSPEFAIQSNLWLMTTEMAKIFAEYSVPVGSSIDGPEEINDVQRGKGYYRKTLEGYKIAVENGLNVRFICTFTNQSTKRKEEIFEFFYENGLVLKLHPALPSLRGSDPDKWALPPEEYGELLVYLLDMALEHLDDMEIMNINDLCRGVFTRRGNVCTFADCMGTTFAIGPDGAIYPCYRFVGMPEYVMGNVYDHPTVEDLSESPAWKLMYEFKDYVDSACSECRHIRYCRGGCPYNAIVPCGGKVAGVDPHCPAYKRIYDEITDRMDDEMFNSPPPGMSPFGAMNGEKTAPGVMSLIRKIVMNQ
ncbi:TIGR04083 family peptide-modifying radical SAM enzyme [Methanoplanus endosymbiosus]|uniref:TIGR04083 family peptide-modifying radical SAM enzyme n=1 Tax=Methanoplanus endosymbiosus TaxID=33865 RepID=A0A9E7PPS9_9EURY|nr:TIGR04083 family peptide-modifying radical SAM enzyme [Methanoplanus endosymbiosus]UUX92801.1 TIGR04083 family peptide-modifying radical SAM enzyme [Methanoplanus endosymbiosus]